MLGRHGAGPRTTEEQSMVDEQPPVPWFVLRARAFVHALLYDEDAAKRYFAVGAYMLGVFLESGGVVPGTTVVVNIGDWKGFGTVCKGVAFYVAAGGGWPSGLPKELRRG